MKALRPTFTVLLCLFSVLGTANFANAQARSMIARDQTALRAARNNPQVQQHLARARSQDISANDVANFQANLQNLVNWVAQNPTNSPIQSSVVSDLQSQVNSMTPDEIATLAQNADVVSFNAAVTTLTSTVPATPILPPTDPPADLSPPQYGICAPRGGPSPIPSDPGTQRALLITIEVLQALQVAIDDFSNINIDVLGEGTNVAAVVVAIVADEIVFALQTTQEELVFCDINAEASQVTSNWQNTIVIDTDIANLGASVTNNFTDVNNQLTAMNTDIDNHLSSIASTTTNQYVAVNNSLTSISTNLTNQLNSVDLDVDSHAVALDAGITNNIANVDSSVKNTTTAVDTSVVNQLTSLDTNVLNRATQIDNEIGAYQTLDLRLKIEVVLAQNEKMESFEIPIAQGGYLETVRSIVSDVISKMLAVSQNVGTATKWLALGDTAYAAKQYKTAYSDYASAYQFAAK